ncbi:MAG: cobalamin-binding protein [Candidatus Omnitrophica bacterium]|nr:cobalamin-binding protein [Candidatus Omnitrophota bacterium]MDD5236938.1 cobalamin-binding protein [Candidatus Omnitrophota bacterium]MDD5610267.1 cobalamin-binding protein [Candidatus Omnitrophota bacterium]
MKKIYSVIGLIVLMICGAAGPGSGSATPRYISLAPSTTEILFALGLDKEIIAVSSFCDYPAQAKLKEKIGDFSRPNIEKIVSLRPDFIFCTGLEQEPAVNQLKRLGFNVYVSDPTNIKELFETISEIGKITHKNNEAAQLLKKMQADMDAVSSKVRAIPDGKKVRVFIEIWHEPLMTAGKGSFIDELITLAGGVNIAHEVRRPYSNFSAEKVVSLNPGCIIMAYMAQELPLRLVASRFGWGNIDAVKNKRIFNDIDPNMLLRPGPRTTEGLKELYQRLYP